MMPKLNKSFKLESNKAGFTLIELLVVILVISALSGVLLSVINSTGIRGKARDSQRMSELKRIQAALELYFSDNRVYPISDGGGGPGTWEQVNSTQSNAIISSLQPDYINPVPVDPLKEVGANVDPCENVDFRRYNYRSDGSYYYLTAIMEVATSNEGGECSSIVGCGAGYSNEDFCYFVQNP